ncbi:MAG: hypothetical protein ACOH5I_00530 [Oligoflexus sp.]
MLAIRFSSPHFHFILLFPLIFLCTLACRPEEIPGSIPHAYLSQSTEDWLAEISVCFLNEDNEFTHVKEHIRKTVEAEYSPLGYQFTNWQSCDARFDSESIQVSIDPKSPSSWVQDFGPILKGQSPGMILGLQHDCAVPYPASKCMENIVIHEFGHVLGLRHEMNRRDQNNCSLDQTGGFGEIDAIQVGDYDPQSIMNYCWLDQQNAKNERVHLSAGDLLALEELRAGRLASFEQIINLIETRENLTIQVTGKELQAYQFAILPELEASCRDETTYKSNIRNISETIDFSDFSSLPDGFRLKLCVRGQHIDGQWQALDAYTSVDFAIEHPTDRQAPQLISITETPQKVTSGESFPFQFTAIDDSQISRLWLRIEPTNKEKGRSSITVKAVPQSIGRDQYHTRVSAKDLDLNGEYFISSLEIEDMMGYRSRWRHDTNLQYYETTDIPLARFEVTGGLDFDARAPELVRIHKIPDEISVHERFELILEITERNPLGEIYIELQHEKLKQSLSLFPVKEEVTAEGLLKLQFELKGIVYQGSYFVSTISLSDIYGLQTYLAADRKQTVLHPSSIVTPSLQIIDGEVYETNSPELTHIHVDDKNLSYFQDNRLTIEIKDESAISYIDVTIEHVELQISLFSTANLIEKRKRDTYLYEILVEAQDFHPAGLYEMKMLRIIDIHGNEQVYSNDRSTGIFSGTQISVPSFVL